MLDFLPLEIVCHIMAQWLATDRWHRQQHLEWANALASGACGGASSSIALPPMPLPLPSPWQSYLQPFHAMARVCRHLATAAKLMRLQFADYYVYGQRWCIEHGSHGQVIYCHRLAGPHRPLHGVWQRRRKSEQSGRYLVVERRQYRLGREYGIRQVFSDMTGHLRESHYFDDDNDNDSGTTNKTSSSSSRPHLQRIEYFSDDSPTPYMVKHLTVAPNRKRPIVIRTEYAVHMPCDVRNVIELSADNLTAASATMIHLCERFAFDKTVTHCCNTPTNNANSDQDDDDRGGEEEEATISRANAKRQRRATEVLFDPEEMCQRIATAHKAAKGLTKSLRKVSQQYQLEKQMIFYDESSVDDDDDDHFEVVLGVYSDSGQEEEDEEDGAE